MKKIAFLLWLFSTGLFAQNTTESLVSNLPAKNIGPSIMSGRVTALAVNPDNPAEFYVGYASGGVWHTVNNGTSYTPVFDNSPTQNVGSLAVDWKNKKIWVGTGEVNSSRSSYAGIGLLMSKDNGETWENMGLEDSHHISKIIINPEQPNEIIVGVLGHLYSFNEQRGVFKTVDGGKTWKKTLFVNNHTGVVDVSVNPKNPKELFATTWDRDRKAWHFKGSGTGSGIYKSTDGGNTWTLVSTQKSGFPTGEGVGRIGVAMFDENTVYAIVDNQNRRPKTKDIPKEEGLRKEDFRTMSVSSFLALEDLQINAFLKNNNFPKKYSAKGIKKQVKKGEVKPADLASYLEDANTLLFDTPVIGAQVYKSSDGGKTWKKTHKGFIDDLYYSYGYYFGRIHVSPQDVNHIYIYGVPILSSKDGGKTFTSINGENVHADHHDLWINPNNPNHLINGNDGGVNISYDDGKHWIKCNTPSVGQFYSVNIDFEKPYNVYGGLQDNGVWTGSHTNEENVRWHQTGSYPFDFIMGGDGMQVQIDKRDSDVVYTGFQFGNYFRLNRKTNEQTYIQPKHELGETPYRFNWQTPILLSEHNQDILYLGGNKLMRSMNQGDNWQAISPDLTKGGKKGNVPYGTLTSISESPFQFGLLYTGSDDGQIYVSKNGGSDWENIAYSFPKDLWVSRIIASQHHKARVYVSLNGYRWDDFTPYVYMSDDYGKTWKNISSNLPQSPVNVIKEDPINSKLLYVGTDAGAFVSLNNGQSWQQLKKDLPAVAVHDLVVQPEENHLVLGTHGRSLYVIDVSLLQKIKDVNQSHISACKTIRHSSRWGSKFSAWGNVFKPACSIQFYNPKAEKVTLQVFSKKGHLLNSFDMYASTGITVFDYDITMTAKGVKLLEKEGVEVKKADNGKYYLPKGEYVIELNSEKINFKIE